MTITLAQNAARVSYTVNQGATQTSFTVSFEFFDAADLNVFVDGTKKTLTTNYSVSGGNGSTGAVSISVTGASGGSTVVITRDIALARTTDFPTSGSFQIAALNTELDRFTAIAADLKDSVDRSLGLTDFDAAATLVLPAVNDRKGKALIFNSSSGNVEAAFQVTAAAVNVSTVSVGGSATATVAVSDGTATFAIGIPTGATGATGATGQAGGGLSDVISDTSPQLGGNLDTNSQNILIDDAHFIGDESGNEQLVFQTTGSAVNHLEITNNASGSNPILSAAGGDTNIGIALTPKGTGEIVIAASNLNYGGTAITSTGAELNKLAGAGTLKQAGKESIWIPAAAMYPSTTNPCSALTQVETTALRPDLKVLDFAAAADDFAQFSVAFPKSWNLGTISYQPFWTVTGTNAGTVVWQLGGVAITSDETLNTAFGTLVATTALAHSTTSNDLMVSAESGAVTVAGSPADNDQCFFQINLDTSASGQTGAVRLLGIKLFFTTDAANDA